MERKWGGDAHRVSLSAADGPAAVQCVAYGGVKGALKIVDEQTGTSRSAVLRSGCYCAGSPTASGSGAPGRPRAPAASSTLRMVLGATAYCRASAFTATPFATAGRAGEDLAGGLGCGDAFLRVLRDHVALELQDPGEHRDKQPGLRVVRRQIEAGARSGRDVQVQTAPLKDFADLEDVFGRAEQPRRVGDADGVADRRLVEQRAEPGSFDRVDAGRCGPFSVIRRGAGSRP